MELWPISQLCHLISAINLIVSITNFLTYQVILSSGSWNHTFLRLQQKCYTCQNSNWSSARLNKSIWLRYIFFQLITKVCHTLISRDFKLKNSTQAFFEGVLLLWRAEGKKRYMMQIYFFVSKKIVYFRQSQTRIVCAAQK